MASPIGGLSISLAQASFRVLNATPTFLFLECFDLFMVTFPRAADRKKVDLMDYLVIVST